jgi:hypothetical protein
VNIEAAARQAREALALAIRAMRAPIDGWKGELERPALDAGNAAIAALDAALSQQAAPAEPVAPVGWLVYLHEPDIEYRIYHDENEAATEAQERGTVAHPVVLYTTPPAPEAPTPLNLNDKAVQKRMAAQWGFAPLPEAQALTDARLAELCVEHGNGTWYTFARAIEREVRAALASSPPAVADAKDAARLDYFEQAADRGEWPNLIFDDDGHWAVVSEGVLGDGRVSVFYGPDIPWHDSVRAAIDAAMAPSEQP